MQLYKKNNILRLTVSSDRSPLDPYIGYLIIYTLHVDITATYLSEPLLYIYIYMSKHVWRVALIDFTKHKKNIKMFVYGKKVFFSTLALDGCYIFLLTIFFAAFMYLSVYRNKTYIYIYKALQDYCPGAIFS